MCGNCNQQDDMTKDTLETQVAVMATNIEHIRKDVAETKRDVKDLKGYLDKHFVTKTEWRPVRQIVFGLVGLIISTVAVAVLGLVIIGSK